MISITWSDPSAPTAPATQALVGVLANIIMDVCCKRNVTYHEMIGKRRSKRIAIPRQEAYWRCSKETAASLPAIGRAFGDRDHTTVLHGIRQHEQRLNGLKQGEMG